MASKRNINTPLPRMSFWKTDGRLFYADPGDLQHAIEQTGLSPEEIALRLGAGKKYLQELFQGGKVSPYTVQLIEWSLSSKET